MYAGFPSSMLTDQGSFFMSKEWEEKCNHALITLRHTGTESHNSLGFGETNHALIRRVFNKVSCSYPSETRELRLALSVKAVNNTAGLQGLVPSLLVFGMILKIFVQKSSLQGHSTRMCMIQEAREYYETMLAQNRVQHALKRRYQRLHISDSRQANQCLSIARSRFENGLDHII